MDALSENQIQILSQIRAFDNIENVTLIGNATEATGNSADNQLLGKELANILNGLAGNDVLVGHAGNDV